MIIPSGQKAGREPGTLTLKAQMVFTAGERASVLGNVPSSLDQHSRGLVQDEDRNAYGLVCLNRTI